MVRGNRLTALLQFTIETTKTPLHICLRKVDRKSNQIKVITPQFLHLVLLRFERMKLPRILLRQQAARRDSNFDEE
jgi:hypothetical protein